MNNLTKLKESTDQIREALSQHIDLANPDEVSGKLRELSSLQGTAAYTLSLANGVVNDKFAQLIALAEFSKLTATDKKIIINGRAKQELFYQDLSEHLLKAIHYSIEELRTQLSYIKSEQNNGKHQEG